MLFTTSHWHALELFSFGIGFIDLRWEGGITDSPWKYCIMNYKSCEVCVLICFYQRQLCANASWQDLLFSMRHTPCHGTWWQRCIWILKSYLQTPTWSLSSSVRSKSFFKLFFQLGNVLINQSSSDCVWWKVKTKLIFLFFFLPHHFSSKIGSNHFKEFNMF